MVPKPTALLCGCSLWPPGDDPHDTCSNFFSSSDIKTTDNAETVFDSTVKDTTWNSILDRQVLDNEETMPKLFRKSESSRKGEVSGAEDTQQPKKGSMRNLFGKKKKNKNSVDATVDPIIVSEIPEEAAPAVVVKEELPASTAHTVKSVGSDVSSSEASEVEEAAPAVEKETVVLQPAATQEKAVEPEVETPAAETAQETPKTEATSDEDAPACYLVYEPDSSGRLVEHYSKTPVAGAVGRWVPDGGKKIAGFKFARNAGRNVLIGSCSAGVQGRRNYCNGWCQFVKSCKILKGNVTLWEVPEGVKAMPVDVYLYYDDARPNHQTIKLEPGTAFTTDKLLAVACLAKGSPFFQNSDTVDIMKWLQDARDYGYSTNI